MRYVYIKIIVYGLIYSIFMVRLKGCIFYMNVMLINKLLDIYY